MVTYKPHEGIPAGERAPVQPEQAVKCEHGELN